MGLPLRFPVFSPHRIHLYLPGENSNRKGAFSSHSAPWFYSQNFSPAVTCRAMPQALRSRPWVAAEIRKLGIGLGPGCHQGEPPGLLTPCAHTDAQPSGTANWGDRRSLQSVLADPIAPPAGRAASPGRNFRILVRSSFWICSPAGVPGGSLPFLHHRALSSPPPLRIRYAHPPLTHSRDSGLFTAVTNGILPGGN